MFGGEWSMVRINKRIVLCVLGPPHNLSVGTTREPLSKQEQYCVDKTKNDDDGSSYKSRDMTDSEVRNIAIV